MEVAKIKGSMSTELAKVKKQLDGFQDHQQQRHEEVVELVKELQESLTRGDDGKKGKGGKKRKFIIKEPEEEEEEENAVVEPSTVEPPLTRARVAGEKAAPPLPQASPLKKRQTREKKAITAQPEAQPKKVGTFLDILEVSDPIFDEDRAVLAKASQEFRPLYYIKEKFGDHLELNQAYTQ